MPKRPPNRPSKPSRPRAGAQGPAGRGRPAKPTGASTSARPARAAATGGYARPSGRGAFARPGRADAAGAASAAPARGAAGARTSSRPASGTAASAPRAPRSPRVDPSTLLYGRHPVAEVLAVQPEALRRLYLAPQHLEAGSSWAPLVAAAQTQGVSVKAMARDAMEALVGDVVHQGAVAEMRPFAYAPLEAVLKPAPGHRHPLVVVLDSVQDPHNLGALVRSAAALGASGVVIAQDRAAEITPTAIKASAGAAFHLPIAQVVNVRRALDTLHKAGVWACGLAAEGDVDVDAVDWAQPMALVVGAEGEGLRPLVAKACNWLARVPIGKVGSLNASVAGAIALFAANQVRKRAGRA